MDILDIDSGALTGAAASYNSAATDYLNALEKIVTNLNGALEAWDDKAKATWSDKVSQANKNLIVVGERMNINAKILSEIAKAVEDTEANVQAGVNSIG